MDNRFDINFFEFSFLVEACIPPKPIARSVFWKEVIDKYYHVLTVEERLNLYKWIKDNPRYKEGIYKNNADCLIFDARYNPDNQYYIHTISQDSDLVEEIMNCFKYHEKYYLNSTTFIDPKYIIDVKPINI